MNFVIHRQEGSVLLILIDAQWGYVDTLSHLCMVEFRTLSTALNSPSSPYTLHVCEKISR